MDLSNPFIAYFAVFIGGLISSFSPCTIAVIPLIIGFVGGYAEGDIKKSALFAGFFSLGLAITFTILGVVAGITGSLLGNLEGIWRYLLAVIAIVMGLQMVGLLKIRLHTFSLPRNSPKGLFGAFILGILFGMASSPCATPVLVVILSYVASEKNILYGGSLLFVYALAHTALILIVGISAGLATNILRSLRIRKVSSFLHQASGVIIIFVGVLIILGIIR